MSTIQIYCICDDNELFKLINKLIEAGADITIYDYINQKSEFESNQKINRLIGAYGKEILPVIVKDGEIVSVEKLPDSMKLINMTGLSIKKLQRAEINIEQYNAHSCNCSKANPESSGCSSCGGCKNSYNCNSCEKNNKDCDDNNSCSNNCDNCNKTK